MSEESETLDRVKAVLAQMKADDRAYLLKWGQHLPGSVAKCAELVEAAMAPPRPTLETQCARCTMSFGHLIHGNTGREGDHEFVPEDL